MDQIQRPTYTSVFETVRGVGNLLAPDDFTYLTEIPLDAPPSQLVDSSFVHGALHAAHPGSGAENPAEGRA